MSVWNKDNLQQLLPSYYRKLFPFKSYYRWLTYGKNPREYFSNREFALILEGDVYLRYQSFNDQSELEKSVRAKCPHKIDIGAVFNHSPKDHKTHLDFDALERELVFDIDLTDYDEIRTCCSEGKMCRKCWRFMVIAVKILDRALKDDFGFEHCLWVYSGRRGVHCWVCDDVARKLTPEGRAAVGAYLTLIVGGEGQRKKVLLGKREKLHSSIQDAVAVMESKNGNLSHFDQLLEEQGWLGEDESLWKTVLDLILDQSTRQIVKKDFENLKKLNKPGSGLWHAFKLRTDQLDSNMDNSKLIKDVDKQNRFV